MALTRAVRVVLAGGLLACGACGLLSDEPPRLETQRDPRIGFAEGPGIEVCIGGRRVAAPARAKAGPLAICVLEQSEAASCDDVSTCRRGEQCVCGRCVTRACFSSTDCTSGEVCQSGRCTGGCRDDAECIAGEVCTRGACAPRCDSRADCAYGESCSTLDGTCIVKLCSVGVTCGPGERCSEQEQVAELREPHVMRWQGNRIAYVHMAAPGESTCAVFRVRIVSTSRWEVEPVGPVVEPAADDDGCLGAPSVLAHDHGVSMFASRGNGTAIVRFDSRDGVGFSRDDTSVWTPRFEWEEGWVGSAAVARFRGRTLMAYEAARGKAIGLLEVQESGQAEPAVTGPWVRPSDLEDPLFWRAIERVGSPFLLEDDGALLVYATARGVEGYDAVPQGAAGYPADANDSIALLASSDGVHLERYPTGPVFARRTNLRAYLGEREPSLLKLDQGAWLVYVGSDAVGDNVTGLASASSSVMP